MNIITRLVLLGVTGVAIAIPARAQDTPVVFVHGIFSDANTWNATAARLASSLRIEPHTVNLPSTSTIETQAGALNGQKGWLPTHTLTVGHSQGGLVAREWSRSKALRGVLTIGTPHEGALLSRRGLDVINFNQLAYNLLGLASAWGTGTEFGWVQAALAAYFANGLQLTWGTAASLASVVAVNGVVPVAPQLNPGSAFLNNLNSGSNLQREFGSLPYRVGLNVIAGDYWRAGVAVGLAPDYREWAWGTMVLLPPTFDYAASYLSITYPYSAGIVSFAMQLRNAAAVIRELDPLWCWAVTDDRACRIPHDGIVPTGSQVYPGAGTVNLAMYGPAHSQETTRSDREIADAMQRYMAVAPRSGSGGGGGTGSTFGAGTRLYAEQQITSPSGAVVLRYQSDGNLVLYGSGGPIWSADTAGLSAGYVEMQGDGNLVVYDQGGVPRWASNTYAPGAALLLHDDGYAAIRDTTGNVVWWTN